MRGAPRQMSLAAVVAMLGLAGHLQPLAAKEPASASESSERIVKEQVTGKFMAATKRMVSIEIPDGKDAMVDLAVSVAPDMQLHNVKALTELKYGDTVTVAYEQTHRDDGQGGRLIVKTEAKHIVLVSRAAQAAAAADEEGAGGADEIR